MASVIAVVASDILITTTWLILAFLLRDFFNPWEAVVPCAISLVLGTGLLFRKNNARIIRVAFAVLSILFSVWIGFWAPYCPFMAAGTGLPEVFSFPSGETLTILYGLFVVWILTRPSTVRLFKGR